MKIDPTAPSATPLHRTPAPGAPAPSTPAEAVQRPKEAPPVSALVHAMPAAVGGSDFDAARVAAIREDIRAGRYEIRPERIADGLLASVRELLAPKGEA
ncbi:FlgM family anti-sigma-28 factor [Variovorax sp. 54]|uniref:flagellar biosynthesis anti-sigma factor FlgM n=1 Tax=Variovorax sp. 54 TaxID=2035212 RepID=UPI000C1A02AD|nr:flagellar biosynthesis anti-sigma factor FlgM [Variovorax sp. 54]PIF74507.1 FlgM family anti-sigma-28 factor [Variovorax sp. 54]